MFTPVLIALLALAYVGFLFVLAWWGDRLPEGAVPPRIRAVVYSLSLAVYCTSWTFFGAVGSAAADGWLFAAIYLGPVLVLVLGHDMMLRIARLSHEQRLTSIADFIAHRFGKSRPLAVLITLAAVLGSIPYIALQLKAVTNGLVIISSHPDGLSDAAIALLLALMLGVFSILFGARRLEANEHHRGMVLAVAFESVVKLVAFAVVGAWALFGLLGGPAQLVQTIAADPELSQRFTPQSMPGGFWMQTLLSAAAIVCLPRQFHVGFVENERSADLGTARWLFPLYLVLITLLVIPVAVAGMQRLSGNADLFMLTLPMSADQPALTLLSFIGGFSAATGMVIVATVALATMVSNDLIAPLLIRMKSARKGDFGPLLLAGRKITILLLALISWIYYLALPDSGRLAALGLMSFAAVVQFAPALVLGLYWPATSREGALAGMALGLGGWLLMTFLPSILPAWPTLLQPELEVATQISLAANLAAVVGVSLWVRRRRPTLPMLLGRRQAAKPVTVDELRRLATNFIGRERVDLAFANALGLGSLSALDEYGPRNANLELVGFCERLLAGCIGSASARSVLTAGLRHAGMDSDQAFALLEQTSSAIQFNRDLLEATLDHIEQGVSVVDADLRLVSWNRAYVELLAYPPGMVYLGRPVEELIRFNLARDLDGTPEQIDAAVNRRLYHMRRRTPYVFERHHADGRVIEIRGNPMPHGGYVTTYTDITGFKRTEAELKSAYETMEVQVATRTRELRETMGALEEAKRDAEQANQSKTRFLAAASHDLLQPLNAARLFASNLAQRSDQLPAAEAQLVARVDHSLEVAEELLAALLDISRLDQGALIPKWTVFPAAKVLDRVERQFSELAERRGLGLRARASRLHVLADSRLLQRVVFNLVNNALMYTHAGGVLVACRRRGDRVRFEVWDTGPGIPEAERERIFEEFERLDVGDQKSSGQGLGLGLAICRRIAGMLQAELELASRPGRGSVFAFSVPLAEEQPSSAHADRMEPRTPRRPDVLFGHSVLCIDDEPEILDGLRLLLERWGMIVHTAASRDQALHRLDAAPHPEVIIADYRLGDGHDGVSVSLEYNRATGRDIPVLVITADRDQQLGERIEALGFHRLLKPVKPAALRSVLLHLLNADGY